MPDAELVQNIIQMRKQGVNDNQIVQQLQQQGVQTQKIFEAMSQADLANISGQDMEPQQVMPQQYPQDYARPYEYQPQGDDRIQEIAESIINEKWEEVISEVQKVIAWKDSIETEVQKLKDEVTSLKDSMDKLRQGILGKVNEYDAHMRDVSSELKAVHQVFKDVIPSFTENVAELSRVTDKLKKPKKS